MGRTTSSKRSCAFPFLELPTVVRHEIWSYLLPESKILWMRKKAFAHFPDIKDPVGSYVDSQDYLQYHSKQFLEREALIHWNIAGLAKSYFPWERRPYWAMGEVAELFYPRGVKREVTPLKALKELRLVNSQFRNEIDELVFTKMQLWIRLDDIESAFFATSAGLHSIPPPVHDVGMVPPSHLSEDYATGNEKPSPEAWRSFVQRRQVEGLLSWISRFRDLNFMLLEQHFSEVAIAIRTIMQYCNLIHNRSHPAPQFQITVCGFREFFKRFVSYDGLFSGHGNGKLPHEIAACEKIQPINTDLWVFKRPPQLRHGIQKEDYIFYKINFSYELSVNDREPDASAKVIVSGKFIHHTCKGTMLKLVGWEPDPFYQSLWSWPSSVKMKV